TSIIVSIIGILQKLGPVRTILATYYPVPAGAGDVTTVSLRISSTLQFFSALAAYLTFIILLALICYVMRNQLKIPLILLVCTVIVDSIALILTGTLAAWIALPIGAFVAFLLMRRLPKLAIFALAGVIVAMIIFQPFIADRLDQQVGKGATTGLLPQSLALRIRIWFEISLPAIGQNLLFGSGPVPLSSALGPVEDSQYIHLLLEGGVFYFLSYCLLMGAAVSMCWQHIKRGSKEISGVMAIALLTILVALNIMNIAGIYFTYAGGTEIVWTLLAIIVAFEQFYKQRSTYSYSRNKSRPADRKEKSQLTHGGLKMEQ
ncbi:MAG: O-antigen ligase family protein, partial [Ktedonobacteraceae bacterium]